VHRKFAPLILHHRITTRIVNVTFIEAWFYSLQVEVCGLLSKIGQRDTAVADKSPLNFGGPLLPKPCLIPVCFEYWDECRVPRKAIKADGKNHARRGRGL